MPTVNVDVTTSVPELIWWQIAALTLLGIVIGYILGNIIRKIK